MEQSQILQAKLEHQIQQITLLNQQLSSTNCDLHSANLQIVALQNDNGLLRKKIELMEQTIIALNQRIQEDAKYIDDLKKQNHHYDKQEQKQQGPTVIEVNNNEFKVLQELNTQLLGQNHELNDKNEGYLLDMQNFQQQNKHLEELLKRKESFINSLEQKFDTRCSQMQNEINNLQQQIASQKQQMFLKQSVNLEEGDPLLIEHYKQLYLELRQKYQELREIGLFKLIRESGFSTKLAKSKKLGRIIRKIAKLQVFIVEDGLIINILLIIIRCRLGSSQFNEIE
ncbi:hypothetical protein pb186bvf_003462 [Paramecium bursaria]